MIPALFFGGLCLFLLIAFALSSWRKSVLWKQMESRQAQKRSEKLKLASLAGNAPEERQGPVSLGDTMTILETAGGSKLGNLTMGCLFSFTLLLVLSAGTVFTIGAFAASLEDSEHLRKLSNKPVKLPLAVVSGVFLIVFLALLRIQFKLSFRRGPSQPLEFCYSGLRLGEREILYEDLYDLTLNSKFWRDKHRQDRDQDNGLNFDIAFWPWHGEPIFWRGKGRFINEEVGEELKDWIRLSAPQLSKGELKKPKVSDRLKQDKTEQDGKRRSAPRKRSRKKG